MQTETRLQTTNNIVRTLLKYVWFHKIMSSVAVYFVVAIFLKLFFAVDVLVPCLWRTLTGYKCPGCGLTTSFLEILKCNFLDAFYTNPLIFIVLPAGIFYMIVDFKRFAKREAEKDMKIISDAK